ncbi:MAG: hypothetical protein R3F49_12155 [Planctomycetota bacterium]
MPHRELANEFLQKHGIDPAADPTSTSIEALLEEQFFHAKFGLLDIAMDASLTEDKRNCEDFMAMALAVTRLQAHFVEQANATDAAGKQALADAKALVAWVGGQRGDALAAAAQGKAGDLLSTLAPPPAVRDAAARFETYMLSGAAVGAAREGVQPEVMLLAPKRRDFHVLLGLFGWLMPDLQGVYWHDGTIPWTNTYFNAVTVVALEYHTGDKAAGSIYAGIDTNARNPTAMQQQVVQLAANAMLTNLYGDRIPPALVGAMAINAVIDLFGECATRVDGDLRERRTEAREVFIPGGQSEGGMLPPNFANSRFRGEEGKDRFVAPLKGCQSAGGTQAKQERKKGNIEHFQILDDTQAKRLVVSAPLLGTPAAAMPPLPEAYYSDGAEFFRAYRTCFLFWLETQGGGNKKKSDELYGVLLRELAALDSSANLEAVIEKVYGRPLSSAKPGKNDLEGRFLAWLAKQ